MSSEGGHAGSGGLSPGGVSLASVSLGDRQERKSTLEHLLLEGGDPSSGRFATFSLLSL